jgi:predicted ATPase
VPLSQDRPVRIPIHNVSSSIKALLILDFYVKYVLPIPNAYKKFLIIDEPELSLHPDNQRKIARLLAMIVNAGVKVMCTTHSDFFIHEFNNLIGLSSLSEEDRQNIISIKFEGNKTVYASDMLLTQDQISCYEMSDKLSNNIVVEKCVVDKYGIEAKYIDDEGSKINNMMQNIQDKFW